MASPVASEPDLSPKPVEPVIHPGAWMHDADNEADILATTLTVSLRDVNYVVHAPSNQNDVPGFFTALAQTVRPRVTKPLAILSDVNLDITPGSMTLVLGNPGAGKSSLLQLIAGRVPNKHLSGVLNFNGVPLSRYEHSIHNVAKYVEQEERHLPLLTVRETLEYAELFQRERVVNAVTQPSKVDTVLKTLRLERAADTVVGNEFVRGVSGGEKRRLTLAEMLMGNPRLLCLDEITTGLDSSTALAINQALRGWANETKGTVVASLLQPIPEIYDLFDQLVLLQDGHVVYAGAREGALGFLERHAGVVCPKDRDFADFIVEYLTDPVGTVGRQQKLEGESDDVAMKFGVTPFIKHSAPAKRGRVLEPEELAQLAKREQVLGDPTLQAAAAKGDLVKRQFAAHYHMSIMMQIAACVRIIGKLHSRNLAYIIPAIQQSILQGLIVGSLWWNLGTTAPENKVSLLFYLITQVTFFNMVEIGVATQFKSVVEKFIDNHFFHGAAWAWGSAIVHLPFAFANLALFFTITYWMADLSNSADDFFRYLVIGLSADLVMSAIFRSTVFFTPSAMAAQVLSPVIGLGSLVFSGYVITYSNVQNWLIWLYYLSPFSWTIRAWALIEFKSSAYSPVWTEASLDAFQFKSDNFWIGFAVLYNLSLYVFWLFLSSWALQKLRYLQVKGTKRLNGQSGAIDEAAHVTVVKVANAANAARDALPFTPASIVWRNIKYTVKVGKGNNVKDKVLLNDVNGVCRPGSLIALMGATGAGKTTLLDVLAQRKRTGVVEGDILINGAKLTPSQFQSTVAYVQQQDCHFGTATVREALRFSAALRLPSSVSEQQRHAMVEETLELLQLKEVADSLVGDSDYNGLSPSQAKRLTFGLELVTNPSVLLADEPTTGLDSKAAMTVLQVLRNVASTGRSIVCTIHQPSAELFFMFDNLLLLQPGGRQVYCGAIGYRGKSVREYFEGVQGVGKMPRRMNPATWMVDVVAKLSRKSAATVTDPDVQGSHSDAENVVTLVTALPAGDAEQKEAPVAALPPHDLADVFVGSTLALDNLQDMQAAITEVEKHDTAAAPRASLLLQFQLLMQRAAVAQWRDVKYNVPRFLVIVFMCLFFGLVFRDLHRHDFATVQSTMGVLCLVSGFLCSLVTQTSAGSALKGRASFYRETAANTYSSALFPLTSFLIEVPWVAIITLAGVPISYFLIGFSGEAARFFLMWFTCFMLCLTGIALGYLFSYALPNFAVVSILMGVSQNIFWLFNGVVTQYSHIPEGWRWFYYITPYNHAANAMAASQMGNSDRPIIVSGTMIQEDTLIDELWGFSWQYRWIQSAYLLAFVVVFLGGAMLAARKVRHVK